MALSDVVDASVPQLAIDARDRPIENGHLLAASEVPAALAVEVPIR